MSYIEVKDVTTGYDNMIISKHVNFTVEKGDYLCIVGENGAGKSTLMKSLLRLTPVLKGEIVYDYPISMAYKDGIFGEIQYVAVPDGDVI